MVLNGQLLELRGQCTSLEQELEALEQVMIMKAALLPPHNKKKLMHSHCLVLVVYFYSFDQEKLKTEKDFQKLVPSPSPPPLYVICS